MKTGRKVPIGKVPKNSNIITCHAIYKYKENDGGLLKMKARIAPHDSKYKGRDSLKIDFSQCPPTGIRILLSIFSMKK